MPGQAGVGRCGRRRRETVAARGFGHGIAHGRGEEPAASLDRVQFFATAKRWR